MWNRFLTALKPIAELRADTGPTGDALPEVETTEAGLWVEWDTNPDAPSVHECFRILRHLDQQGIRALRVTDVAGTARLEFREGGGWVKRDQGARAEASTAARHLVWRLKQMANLPLGDSAIGAFGELRCARNSATGLRRFNLTATVTRVPRGTIFLLTTKPGPAEEPKEELAPEFLQAFSALYDTFFDRLKLRDPDLTRRGFGEAIEFAKRAGPAARGSLWMAQQGLGHALFQLGLPAEALPWLEQALATVGNDPSFDPTARLTTEYSIAWTHDSLGNLKQAETLMRDWQRAVVAMAGDESFEAIHSLVELGSLLVDRRRYAEASGLLRRAVGLSETLFGEVSSATDARSLLAVTLVRLNDPRAEDTARRALAQAEQCGGDKDIAAAKAGVGLVEYQQGRYDHAAALHEAAFKTINLHQPWHPYASEVARMWAHDLLALGRTAEGRARLEDAVRVQVGYRPAEHPERKEFEAELAALVARG